MKVGFGMKAFPEQLEFFRDKVPMGTDRWDDIGQGQHARAFVIAGEARDGLLTDVYKALDKAIVQGQSRDGFRKDFTRIATAYGWSADKAGYRVDTIFETNMRQSYAAGRELQMRDENLRKLRPYGLYRHGGSEHPREEHKRLDGLVLPLDDPFWDTWTPPNGWGCKCKKFMISAEEAAESGYKIAESAPDIPIVEIEVPWSRNKIKVPKGIDPTFAYNPGTAAWGRSRADRLFKESQYKWDVMTKGDWKSAGRPETLPFTSIKPSTKAPPQSKTEMVKQLEAVLGGPQKVISAAGGLFHVNVDADYVAKHLGDLGRASFFPELISFIERPQEVWESFQQNERLGKVALRRTLIRNVSVGGKHLVFVAEAQEGGFVGYTFYPASGGANKRRVGRLLFAED